MDASPLVRRLLAAKIAELDIAVGVLWHAHKTDSVALSAAEIGKTIRAAGGASINSSRLKEKLKLDGRVATRPGDRFEINLRRLSALDQKYAEFSGPVRPKNSGSVLDVDVFEHARKYVRNIV